MRVGKRWVILGLVVAAAALMLSATREWIRLELVPGAAAATPLSVTGGQVASALMPIAIALLAVAIVLTIAGPVLRRVLGVLILLLGGWVSWSAWSSAVPAQDALVSAAASELTRVTGLGSAEHLDIVADATQSAWPVVAGCAGILVGVLGLLVVIASGSWQRGGNRYESQAGTRAAGAAAAPDRISDWDNLSDGVDPSQDGSSTNDPEAESPGGGSTELPPRR